jgi:hypothetical protein
MDAGAAAAEWVRDAANVDRSGSSQTIQYHNNKLEASHYSAWMVKPQQLYSDKP